MKPGKLRTICALILALAMLTASVSAFAAYGDLRLDDTSYITGAGTNNGTCGDGVTWSIANGKLTIGGKGAMQDFLTWDNINFPYPQPWYNRGDITSLEIGSGVTYIGMNAFRSMQGLKSVTIPSTVESIGFAAFGDCYGLSEATIDCKRLGESAFIRCMNMTSVNVGPHVTDMGISAFEDCHGLTVNDQGRVYITDLEAWCKIVFGGISANPVEKAHHIYLNGSELKDLTIPAGLKKVNDYSFINAAGITSVTIPEGVEEIGEYAFYGCGGIATLNLPASSLKKIGSYAFESCVGLRTLANFPASIENYGAYCFRFVALAEYVTIPSGYIGRGAFDRCNTIGDLILGENITFIGENAFNIDSLRQVTYGGTQADWDAIPKGAGNDKLLSVPLICKDSTPAVKPGNTGKNEVNFGKYDGEDITWLILDSKDGKTLLLSKKILEFVNYDINSRNIPWANSDLRQWLNKDFLNSFTPAEQAKIVETEVAETKNSRYGTSAGPATKDKVFLLSEEEVHKYFPVEDTAAAKSTKGAYDRSNKSANFNPDGSSPLGDTAYWWLRTKGMYAYQAAYVDYVGYVHAEGMVINNNIAGARPAIWVDTGALYGGVYDFVTRCYKLILGRDPDEGGLKGWCDALMTKAAAAANIIDSFIKSDEFTARNVSAADAVDILYNTMLGRAADEGGKAGWVDALNQGYSLQHIIAGFCGSPEFTAICQGFGIDPGTVTAGPVNPQPADDDEMPDTPRGKIEAFVKRCYKLILNRDADEGGLKGWSDALETRAATAAQIIDGFVRSDEYTSRNISNADSVDILYRTMLDRAADEGGKAGWVDAMAQGYTLQHIINGFCGSDEFTAICDRFGIIAGSVAVSGVMLKREAITPEGDEEAAPVIYVNFTSEYTDEAKVKAFVEHCYEAVFGREGDAEGVAAYTKLIMDGKKTPKKVAYEFIFSPEFQNRLPGNEAFIEILYRLYFDRVPGAEELAGWVAMLEGGAGLEEIVNGFATSDEFKAIIKLMHNS